MQSWIETMPPDEWATLLVLIEIAQDEVAARICHYTFANATSGARRRYLYYHSLNDQASKMYNGLLERAA